MAKESLVERDLDEGRRLVEALDRSGFPVTAALWTLFPDEGGWRLLIASPKVSAEGPRAVYAAIQAIAIAEKVDIPIHHVSAVPPEDKLVGELRGFAGTDGAPFIGTTRIQKAMIGDAYVEDAYVYRAERIIGHTGTQQVMSIIPDKERKVWTVRPARVVVEDGFIKQIEVDGYDLPQTQSRNGVNAHLGLVANPHVYNREPYGDVQRLSIRDGRIRSIEIVVTGVRLHGIPEAPTTGGRE